MVISDKLRWVMFATAVLVFLVAAAALVIMARGYTFDFDEQRFVLTGAVTTELNVSANVTVDGRELDASGLLAHAYGLDGLAPGAHTLRAERDGYSSWSKTVSIEEGRVTSFPEVLLIDLEPVAASRSRLEIRNELAQLASLSPSPTPSSSPSPEPVRPSGISLENSVLSRDGESVDTNVKGYRMSDDGSRIVWWTRNEVWVMWLRDTREQPFMLDGDVEIITRLSTSIDDVIWWPDRYHLAILSGDLIFVSEIDTRGGTNIVRLP